MNRELREHPLAELVREISLKSLSGTLRLQHEGVKVAVYFAGGELIFAAANVRELRLAEYLKKQQLVSETQLSALGSNRSDASLVSALCKNGTLDRKSLDSLISRQVSDILRVALLWTKGKWEFDDRSHLRDNVNVKLDLTGLLLQSARKVKSEFAASRFPHADELISPVSDLPAYNNLLPAEGFVLSRVDNPIKLSELIALSGLPEAEATKTIYGLLLGGFIQRENQSDAVSVTQDRISASAVSSSAQEVHAPEPVSPREQTKEERLDELDQFLARLDNASNHYEVLDVTTTAPPAKIKRNYYSLAKKYHPDRFHVEASALSQARIEAAFAKITQAYETLTDSRRRAGYDAKLAAQEKVRQFAQSAPKAGPEAGGSSDVRSATISKDPERAETAFKEGFAALRQGHAKLALTNLAAAAQAVPQDARYRAYYGRALATEERTRRLAEAELQSAIRLDPTNASYRVMLAEVYYDLGLFRRAEGELERANSLDPNNADAQKLMRRLEAARTAK